MVNFEIERASSRKNEVEASRLR